MDLIASIFLLCVWATGFSTAIAGMIMSCILMLIYRSPEIQNSGRQKRFTLALALFGIVSTTTLLAIFLGLSANYVLTVLLDTF